MTAPALFAAIDFQPIIPGGYIVLIAVVAGALLVYITAKVPRSIRLAEKVGLFLLRALFFGALILLLLNPGRRFHSQPEEEKAVVIWMLDRSKSMTVPDVDGGSRWAAARAIVGPYLAPAGESRLVHRVFLFDSRIREAAPAALNASSPAGDATNIPASLEDVFRAIPSGLRVPAVFLISDGIQTAEADRQRALVMASARQTRIYPILTGGDVAVADLAVRALGGRKVSFIGHPINLHVELAHQSVAPRRVAVKLVHFSPGESTGRLLAQKWADVAGTGKQTVTFQVKNDKPGFYRYAIETDPLEGELNQQNNRDQTDVITLNEKIQILLVEGNPYWETKYLVQLLQKDESINIKAIFMLARGRAFQIGEASDQAKEDDQAGGGQESLLFPDTLEELRRYNLVILGQDVRFLIEPKHATLLESFLYDHGGALLFARGKPYSGKFPLLARLEPIVWGQPLADQSLRLMPTELGLRLPMFQYDLTEPLAETMRSLPKVSPRHRVDRLKSFSEAFAHTVASPQEEPIPALIVRRMGKGIVATVNAEGMWRWDFMPPRLKQYRGVYPTFWGQLIRWMALRSDFLPGQNISFRSSGVVFNPGQLIGFTVAQRFPGDRPLEPTIRIFRGAKVVQTLVPGRSRARAHVWRAMCVLDEPGSYEVKLFDGETLYEKMTLALTVKPRASETSELSADPGYLETIARQTGGRLLRAGEVEAVVRNLARQESPTVRARQQWRLAWDSAGFLLLAAGLAALEWAWRRRRGLL